jgi:Flp pilus assembly protein TadG
MGVNNDMPCHTPDARRGASASELAVVLPVLLFILVIAADYARVYYNSITITSSARQGAMLLYSLSSQMNQNYPIEPLPPPAYHYHFQEAAWADATNLNPQPTVTGVPGSGLTNFPATVTATGTFSTVTGYPGIPPTVNLSRTVKMRVPAVYPK